MKPHELEILRREVALELARKALETADFSCGLDRLTADQLDVYDWLEMLYYDGEISYGQLWALCPSNPLPSK